MTSALLVGFDFAVREGFLRMLGDPPVGAGSDRLVELLNELTASASLVLGRVVSGAWRAALTAVAEGSDPQQARAALFAIQVHAAIHPNSPVSPVPIDVTDAEQTPVVPRS